MLRWCWCIAPLVPLIAQLQISPLHYHAYFVCDSTTNANWYAVIVRSNGVEIRRWYAMTNWVLVSNIVGNLDAYHFTMLASNSLNGLVSDESDPPVIHWVSWTNQISTSLNGPWMNITNYGMVPTGMNYLRLTISNFDANSLLRPD